jgi:polyketide biosynthesis enoyl-CoA hydratase PksH
VELIVRPLVITVPGRLDPASVAAMSAQLANLDEAPAVILEGRPDAFCLGMTFDKVLASGGPGSAALRRDLESFALLMSQILNAPRPTLAVIDGRAFGGGLGLAAACDCVLASPRATFSLPEALYGLEPAIIRTALLTRLTVQKLNFLLFSCHSRTAAEAHAIGLVDRIVEVDQLERAKTEIARQFSRAKSETVINTRLRNAAAVALALEAGVSDTAAALASDRVSAALDAAADDEELPWMDGLRR